MNYLDRRWEQIEKDGRAQHGSKWDGSGLDRRFLPFYPRQRRIKVRTLFGDVTGLVGKTTGWKPSFLLLRRSDSHGSSILLGPEDEILAVQERNGRYRELTPSG